MGNTWKRPQALGLWLALSQEINAHINRGHRLIPNSGPVVGRLGAHLQLEVRQGRSHILYGRASRCDCRSESYRLGLGVTLAPDFSWS